MLYISLIFYLLSVWLTYRSYRITYKEGVFPLETLEMTDVYFIFIPILNLLVIMILWSEIISKRRKNRKRKKKQNQKVRRFFKI